MSEKQKMNEQPRSPNGLGGKYPCEMSPSGYCDYGGGKNFNYGFVKGTASYCRFKKAWVHNLKVCPISNATNEDLTD